MKPSGIWQNRQSVYAVTLGCKTQEGKLRSQVSCLNRRKWSKFVAPYIDWWAINQDTQEKTVQKVLNFKTKTVGFIWVYIKLYSYIMPFGNGRGVLKAYRVA